MQYKFKNEQDKIQFARQLADYISKNKFKQQNTNEALYSDIIKSLKNSKDINLQGMDGFKYNSVNKTASIGDSIKDGWKAFKDFSRENQWVQPTLQGAAGAGIGALTGLLMGPKHRAMKLLISTLGGAGIGVGTGFATNYALKEGYKAEERAKIRAERDKKYAEFKRLQPQALAKADQLINNYGRPKHAEEADRKQMRRKADFEKLGIRPSDRLLYQTGYLPAAKKQELLWDISYENGFYKNPTVRIASQSLYNTKSDAKRQLRGEDLLYNLAHPDTLADKIWRSERKLEALSPQRQKQKFINDMYNKHLDYLLRPRLYPDVLARQTPRQEIY